MREFLSSFSSRFILALGVLAGVWACERPPELPVQPTITFQEVRFAPGPNGFDSLVVTIGFEDGDGDLGLLGSENDPPFNPLNFPTNSSGDFILFGDPEAPEDFNVCDFVTDIDINNDQINDTVHVEVNPNSFNIDVDFFIKRNGEYSEFDWRREFGPFSCITFDGRFPPLNSEEFERPLAGSLSYSMVSSGFLPIFGNDSLQLRIQIKDRALNFSNIAESPDFIVGQ